MHNFFGVPRIAVCLDPSLQPPALCPAQVDLLLARSWDAVLVPRLVPVATQPVEKYNPPEKYYRPKEELAACFPREENPLLSVVPSGLGMRGGWVAAPGVDWDVQSHRTLSRSEPVELWGCSPHLHHLMAGAGHSSNPLLQQSPAFHLFCPC